MKEIQRIRVIKNKKKISYRCSRCEKCSNGHMVLHSQNVDDFSFKHSPFNMCPYATTIPKILNTNRRCIRCRRRSNQTFKQQLGMAWSCETCESKTLHFVTRDYILPLTIECDMVSFKKKGSIGICWQCALCKSCIVSEVSLCERNNVTFYCPFC